MTTSPDTQTKILPLAVMLFASTFLPWATTHSQTDSIAKNAHFIFKGKFFKQDSRMFLDGPHRVNIYFVTNLHWFKIDSNCLNLPLSKIGDTVCVEDRPDTAITGKSKEYRLSKNREYVFYCNTGCGNHYTLTANQSISIYKKQKIKNKHKRKRHDDKVKWVQKAL